MSLTLIKELAVQLDALNESNLSCTLLKQINDFLESGAGRIALERERQIEKEGWTLERDKGYAPNELALVGALYAANGSGAEVLFHDDDENEYYDAWPWDEKWDKRKKHSRVHQLEIAGAMMAAELDVLENKKTTDQTPTNLDTETKKIERETIEWVADILNAVVVCDDGSFVCQFCGSEQIDDDRVGDSTRADVVHWPNCLHLLARAYVSKQ